MSDEHSSVKEQLFNALLQPYIVGEFYKIPKNILKDMIEDIDRLTNKYKIETVLVPAIPPTLETVPAIPPTLETVPAISPTLEDDSSTDQNNTNCYLLGTSNGVLELNPRVIFRKYRSEDNITFRMGYGKGLDAIPYEPYDPASPTLEHKAILNFYKKLYPDSELCEYVLTLDAACLEGENREQRFYFEQGRGSNGKSMKQTLKRYTFGDYATSLQTTALTRKRPDSGAASPDIIVLKGKRYIFSGEPDPGEKLNSARMKQLCSGEDIGARRLYGNMEKFKLMGKIFLVCNDLPQISAMDTNIWRRIRVIPHVATFVNSDIPEDPEHHIYHKDFDLSRKICETSWRVAYLGILVYYYETRYLKFGLVEPDSVKVASEKYRIENDTFSAFAAETFVVETGAGPIKLADILTKYREWKKAMPGATEMKKAMIVERMKSISARGSTEVEFKGVRFVDDHA